MSERLRAVKGLHTGIWAFFAGCILATPVATAFDRLDWAAGLIAMVGVEVLVLGVNGGRCPLTAVAARYTDDRQDNFDIYLPVWLARYNKWIFGSLWVAGVAFTAVRWLATR